MRAKGGGAEVHIDPAHRFERAQPEVREGVYNHVYRLLPHGADLASQAGRPLPVHMWYKGHKELKGHKGHNGQKGQKRAQGVA